MNSGVRAVRGATQVSDNESESIRSSVIELVETLLEKNHLERSHIISILFSQTRDVTSLNPATALRSVGYAEVPLFCTQEPEYDAGEPRMIRVLLTFSTNGPDEIVPVYLNGAASLRSDLT